MLKNRTHTEKKIIRAVGEVIKAYGYTGLGINKIARTAGVNKNLIYRYFETVENLVEIYIKEKDYWVTDNEVFEQAIGPNTPKAEVASIIIHLLQSQFKYFFQEKEMQHIILSEITHDHDLLKQLSEKREKMAETFFVNTERFFQNSGINFRGICAILNAGIYYLVLQSQKNDATNCGLNMKLEQDRLAILQTIEQIINWTFQQESDPDA